MKKTIIFLSGMIFGTVFMISSNALASNNHVKAFIASFNYQVNGIEVNVEENALAYDGKSYLPVRDIAKVLGFSITYDDQTRTIEFANDTVSANIGKSPTNTNETKEINLTKSSEKLSQDEKKLVLVDGLEKMYLTDEDRIDFEKLKSDIENETININSQDTTSKKSLLMIVIEKEKSSFPHYLISKGIDVNLIDSNGKTALHYAVIYERSSVGAELLYNHKTKVNVKDDEGKRPIDYADKDSAEYRALKFYVE